MASSPGASTVGPSAPAGAAAAPAAPVAPTPLRRLTRVEYVNTVKAALPALPTEIPEDDLPSDETVHGFPAQTSDLLNQISVGQYWNVALEVAAAASAKADAIIAPCERGRAGDLACATAGLAKVLPVLFRREVAPAELEALLNDFFKPVYAAQGGAAPAFAAAFESALARALMSPSFLFKVERGDPVTGRGEGAFRLSARARAARLSYFLWQAPPDDALVAAAGVGGLDAPASLDALVERMLADPRAQAALRRFMIDWLKLRELPTLDKPGSPLWSPALRTAVFEETARFVDHVVRQGQGRFADLFTAQYSFVDRSAARIYGLEARDDEFRRVELVKGGPRAGILTQPAVLAVHHHDDELQMIFRGLLVREQLLCQDLPRPPDDVDTGKKTDRLVDPQCAGCHLNFEPIGNGFAAYDGVGVFQDRPARGLLTGLASGPVEFSTVPALGAALAAAPETPRCLARQLFRYAHGRDALASEAQALERAVAAMGDGDVRRLLASLVASESFSMGRDDPAPACSSL
jgi:hypothetical protein